jgi:hypothetical protein
MQEVKRQFSAVAHQAPPDLSDLTTCLADWIASRRSMLDHRDVELLVAVGSALHLIRMEQEWQRSWT